MKQVRTLLLYAITPDNATLSYQRAWPRHFLRHPQFDCTGVDVFDVGDRWDRLRVQVGSRLRLRYDAVVLLHSVFSNVRLLQPRLAEAIRRLSAVKVFFIGNEYKLMPQKMAFCEEVGIDLLVSQFTALASLDLYRQRLGCAVVGIPVNGLDVDLFAPRVPPQERPLDLGYRAHTGGLELGHDERRELAERFTATAEDYGLDVDISLDPGRRFAERDWAAFLNRCKGQIGSEAGGDYFELTDETRTKVLEYLREFPDASLDEVRERFFAGYSEPVPGRALAGRVIEAAGTKTVQILLEGRYGGYFESDVHYIPLRKDFSNLDEAIAKFRDPAIVQRVTEQAYDLARSELTYERLIDRFHGALAGLL